MRKTKIICTIGPSSADHDTMAGLMKAGMNVARLNFSHSNHEEHREKIELIKSVREELGMNTAILLDTKGPEIRTGKFIEEEYFLTAGQKYDLHCDDPDFPGDDQGCAVLYSGLAKDVSTGGRILIDDGLLSLVIDSIEGDVIHCTAENGGRIKNNKGVNIPGVKISLPSLTEKDRDDLLFGIDMGVDFVAASFVRKADDVHAIRKVLVENGGQDIRIISKIENKEGLDNIDEIIEASDGIMVARGDLGVEIPEEDVPVAQKLIIDKCNKKGVIVVTATQMLDSMIRNPRPTRAEVTDVANAILDGTDAIMLSGETASGRYPIESVETMNRIALKAESVIDYKALHKKIGRGTAADITDIIGHCVVRAAEDVKATALLTPTTTGNTAFAVAKFRPVAPIVAPVYRAKVARRLALCWGTVPAMINRTGDRREIYAETVQAAVDLCLAEEGDPVVITAGEPLMIEGNTNMMRIHIVGEELV